jgi:hypothetical protein
MFLLHGVLPTRYSLYSTVRCLLRYDPSCWFGLILSFTSSPRSYKCDIVRIWSIGFPELSGLASLILRVSLLSPTGRYGRGRPDQTSNVAIYAHASESSTIVMFTRSCHPQLGCIDDLNLACFKHLNNFQATTSALTCLGDKLTLPCIGVPIFSVCL